MKSQVSAPKILEHGKPVGTSTEDDVIRRAKEIAETRGALPDQYNEADVDQARSELRGTVSKAADHADEPIGQAPDWTEVSRSSPNKPETKVASDEQTVAERLVKEGVDEASHDRAIEGNRSRRAADEE